MPLSCHRRRLSAPLSPEDRGGSSLDLHTVDHLLATTRSVRKRLDLHREVPREVILECLRLAIQAPSAGNGQPWRWVVVTEPTIRAGLADVYRRGVAVKRDRAQAQASVVRDERQRASSRYLTDHLHEVPVLVVPCYYASEHEGPANGATIYPAIWSFQLALRSRGLGSCITTSHLECGADAAELLGIPEYATQAALVAVAYFTGDDFLPAQRRDVSEVTYWDGWRGQ